jgi:catechol 2,3-dioxygenase-like lactoylglutathione lyase family enzyme
MIDHVGFHVSDIGAARSFYETALKPLGYRVLAELTAEMTGGPIVLGFGAQAHEPDFWLSSGEATAPATHVAFRVDTREAVRAFHAAALAAGGTDNGEPGPRPHYHPNYYAAFVRDPDGHNIEAVCHLPVERAGP